MHTHSQLSQVILTFKDQVPVSSGKIHSYMFLELKARAVCHNNIVKQSLVCMQCFNANFFTVQGFQEDFMAELTSCREFLLSVFHFITRAVYILYH